MYILHAAAKKRMIFNDAGFCFCEYDKFQERIKSYDKYFEKT